MLNLLSNKKIDLALQALYIFTIIDNHIVQSSRSGDESFKQLKQSAKKQKVGDVA